MAWFDEGIVRQSIVFDILFKFRIIFKRTVSQRLQFDKGHRLRNEIVIYPPCEVSFGQGFKYGFIGVKFDFDVDLRPGGAGMDVVSVGPCFTRNRTMPVVAQNILFGQIGEVFDVWICWIPACQNLLWLALGFGCLPNFLTRIFYFFSKIMVKASIGKFGLSLKTHLF